MKVLFLDDEGWRHDVMDKRHPRDEVWHAYTIEHFRKLLRERQYDVISLDHDLAWGENGMMAVDEIIDCLPREQWPTRGVIVHSWNESKAALMFDTLHRAGVNVIRRQFKAI